MSRRGREGAPSDEQLLTALDRLVEVEGIVKAAEVLEVSYRTASNCHESRHISRKMRGVLEKHLREQREQEEQGEQGEQGEQQEESGEQETPPTASEPGGGEGPRLQEPEHDLRREVDEVDDHDEGKQQRTVSAPRRVFPS